MDDPNRPKPSPSTLQGLTHSAAPESLEMNIYHVRLVVTKLLARPQPPSLAGFWGAVTTLLAIVLCLLTTDFKDFLGVKADTWEAFVIFLAVACLIAIAYLFHRWSRSRKTYKDQTDEEIVSEIIADMEETNKRVLEMNQRKLVG
jgi:hypothetical protein